MNKTTTPFCTTQINGVGVGFRTPYFADIMQCAPSLGWFEVLADNYFTNGEVAHRQLAALRADYPIALHSVGMSLGSVEPLDFNYLRKIKDLADCYASAWVSDHLCFVGVDGFRFHDLLPLPYTEEAVKHTAVRIRQVQDYLGQRILIENVSSYVSYQSSNMTEPEFLNAVAAEADCWLLLDLNNLYVSAYNHNDNARTLMRAVAPDRVKQLHLGGFQSKGDYLLDAHSRPVCDQVWELFADFIRHNPEVPALIEWDNDLPDFAVLLAQAERAQTILTASQKPTRGALSL